MEWKELLLYLLIGFVIILVSGGLFVFFKIRFNFFKKLLEEFQSEISNLKYFQKDILNTTKRLNWFNEDLKNLQSKVSYLGKGQLGTGYKLDQLEKNLKGSQSEVSYLKKSQLDTVYKLDQLDKNFKGSQLEILEIKRFQLDAIREFDRLAENLKSSQSEILKVKDLQLNANKRFDQLRLEIQSRKFKTFCPLPWMHLSLHPSGKTRLCCNADHKERNIRDRQGHFVFIDQIENIESFFNLSFYKNIRRQMLNNQKPKACSTCYELEKHGSISSRQQFKKHWKTSFPDFLASTKNDGTLTEINVKYLDLPLGNLCNLRCRMCNPFNSIQMKKDFDYLDMNYSDTVNQYGKWIKNPDLQKKLTPLLETAEEIFFTGGEPLLIREHENILRKAIELKTAKNIKIKYNSNLTKLNGRLLNLWKEFREVEFNCSIDGFGKVNDYIRFPSKWSVMDQALKTLDDLSEKYPHIKIYIHSTFQVLNLFNIPDLLKWLRKAKWRNIYRVPHFIWLHEPKFLRASVLPDSLKLRAIDKVEKTLEDMDSFFMEYNKNHIYWSREQLKIFSGYLNRLRNTPQEKEQFKEFTRHTAKMDYFRKQDITQVIPEFKVLFYKKSNQRKYEEKSFG